MTYRYKFRQGTAALWTSVNPVLISGEPGYETDTGRQKIGDGVTAWASLEYAPDGGDVTAAIATAAADATTKANAAVTTAGTYTDTIKPTNGARAVGKGELFIYAADYGLSAAGTQAANATALTNTLAAAGGRTILIPPETCYTDEVAAVGPVEIQGAGQGVSHLRNASGSVFAVAGSQINVSRLKLTSGGSNHTIRQTGAVDQCHWDRVVLDQLATGYSVWDNAGYAFIDMRFTRGLSRHLQTATVPTWNLVAAGGLINDNVWEKWRADRSGNYHFWVESTNANAQYMNAWRDMTWEVCTGGLIRLISVRDYVIDNGANWDLNSGSGGVTTMQNHGINATANASSISCVGVVRRQSRHAGSNAGGIFDLSLPTSGLGSGTLIENCRTISGADPYTIDLKGNNCYVYAPSTTTSLTASTGAIVLSNAGLAMSSTMYVRTGYAATASVPTAATSGAGGLFVDSTLKRLRVSDGTNYYATNGVLTPLATKTTSYNMAPSDDVIVANGATVTVSLPDPTGASAQSRRYTVKNINAASATVNSQGSSKTIDGVASMTLAQWVSQDFISDATQWLKV